MKNEENKEPIPVAVKVNKCILKHFCRYFIKYEFKQLKEGANDNAKLELIREAHLLKSAEHKNLIKFYGIVFDENESSTFPEYIVLEYMNKGDLLNYLRTEESKQVYD